MKDNCQEKGQAAGQKKVFANHKADKWLISTYIKYPQKSTKGKQKPNKNMGIKT